MSFFRNIQVAKMFKVSNSTVANWIERAEKGDINLDLATVNGRKLIVDSEHNHFVIEQLKLKGKKHTKKEVITVKPKPEIYEYFTPQQLINLLKMMSAHHHCPVRYYYLGEGASLWDKVYNESEVSSNSAVNKELELIDTINYNLEKLLNGYDKINIIDLGPGNGKPIRAFIDRFKKKINDLINIDISKQMLNIAKLNTEKKYSITPVEHIIDIENQSFGDILFASSKNNTIPNICVYLGGTIENNFNRLHTLTNISLSLNINDYLVIVTSFDVNGKSLTTHIGNQYIEKIQTLPLKYLNLLDYVTVSDTIYYENIKSKKKFFTFDTDINLEIIINDSLYNFQFSKNSKIELFTSYRYIIPEIISDFNKADLQIVNLLVSEDNGLGVFLLQSKKR